MYISGLFKTLFFLVFREYNSYCYGILSSWINNKLVLVLQLVKLNPIVRYGVWNIYLYLYKLNRILSPN